MGRKEIKNLGIIAADEARRTNANSSGGNRSGKMFRLLPADGTGVAINRVFINALPPGKGRIFRGMYALDEYQFYQKIMGHYVHSYDEDGAERTEFVLCKEGMLAYADGLKMHYPALDASALKTFFGGETECPLCVESRRWSEMQKERRKILAAPRMSKEVFLEYQEQHAELKKMYKEQSDFKVKDRYILSVLDIDKLEGKKALSEAEVEAGGMGIQLLMAPPSIFDELLVKFNAKQCFWDISNPRITQIVKNNKKGPTRSEYKVELEGGAFSFSPEMQAYLDNDENIPDPSDFCVNMPNNMLQAYVRSYLVDNGLANYTASNPVMASVAAAPVVAAAAPQGQVAAPAPIQRIPVQVAPVAVAPVAAVAPVVVPVGVSPVAAAPAAAVPVAVPAQAVPAAAAPAVGVAPGMGKMRAPTPFKSPVAPKGGNGAGVTPVQTAPGAAAAPAVVSVPTAPTPAGRGEETW